MFLRTFLLSFLFILSLSISATGPSYIGAKITPISINEKGEVLCKTRFEKNGMGAHYYMRIEFGFCVLTGYEIIYFPGVVVDPEDVDHDEDAYIRRLEYWEEIFKSETSTRRLNSIVSSVLKDKYQFESCNAGKYKVDEFMTLDKAEQEFSINWEKDKQQSLFGSKSLDYQGDKVMIQYHIGNYLILENYATYEEDQGYGAYFNYPNDMLDYDFEHEFDVYWVTGVLRLN